MSVPPTPKAFFAYPSDPPSIGEIIRTAIHEVNKSGLVIVKSWEECRVGGKLVIQEICDEIQHAEIFCADLTGMNANVMFELGYAIAKNRRIWLALDTSFQDSKTHFDQLRILTTIGYSRYCNSRELIQGFYKDKPFSDVENTVFEKSIRPSLAPKVSEKVLYLKSRHETEASIRISNSVEQLKAADIAVIVDDPKESTVQSLTWYGVQAYSTTGVICHLTGTERTGARLHNARYALVSGIAFGMQKKLLMLTEGEFLAPIDYRDLLCHYKTASEALKHFEAWRSDFEKSRYEQKTSSQNYFASVALATELKGLQVGEYIAENEGEKLVEEYFVETAQFREGLSGSHSIFVGRKGTGKTANFLKLAHELSLDKRNLACIIKPVAYDLHGIVSLLRKYKERDAKGYAVESLWKFLLYTEIANAAAKVLGRILPSALRPEDEELLRFLGKHEKTLSGDFTVRLERCVGELLSIQAGETTTGSAESVRVAISESLHQGILKQLRLLLGKALTNKVRVAILVDNLDKAWDRQSDITSLTEFLLGLLSAAARLPVEFKHEDAHRLAVNLSLAVFLRSDIFYKLLDAAREPDKIVHSKINWNDKELLIRLIDERLVSSHQGLVQPAELWAKYFSPSVRGIPTREYLC